MIKGRDKKGVGMIKGLNELDFAIGPLKFFKSHVVFKSLK